MKALDRDLRERILRAVDRGEPMPSVAARFEVGYSTVKKWKRRRRETGAAEALTHRCGRKRALSPEQSDRLVALVAEDPGRTLPALRAELRATCCLTAIWNELRRRGLSHKKTDARRGAGPPRRGRPA
jgi:transposase